MNTGIECTGPVIYWMQRDQRAEDNRALLYAADQAKENKVPLLVVFNLVPKFLEAGFRQYDFMIKGLIEVEETLDSKNIPFILLTGDPGETIPEFVKQTHAGLLVADFNPLKNVRNWKKKVISKIEIPFHTVDAHNIIPAWITSEKQEFAARTIRPKIHKKLDQFLTGFPTLNKQPGHGFKTSSINWQNVYDSLDINHNIKPVDGFVPGSKAADKVLKEFIETRLNGYDKNRNDPNLNGESGLSPYLHYGQISAQKAAIQVKESGAPQQDIDAFLEQLIVRRELSDNFCLYNTNYDNYDGFPDWAKETLGKHAKDEREHIYSLKELEEAKTADDLWNAAQLEMVNCGKMHNYMRMYWAKKILEWTPDPASAMEYTVILNDRYELDGRDPNGYVGAAWAIGGVHDRPWQERPVFGKIRYMNYNGAKRKFDVECYINKNLKR